VKGLPGMNDISLDYPTIVVRDGTAIIEKLSEMKGNLKSVGWADFVGIWEEHQAVPLVRCPWGCSEYYGNVNTVAFDVFINWYLKGSVDLYSSESERRCCIGFRENVISRPVHILNNPDLSWQCLITLTFVDGKGFRVCTCRYHSPKDTLEYIHPPTNPTGTIAFPGDNELAQVVVVPRTIRSFQAKTYSNSYQLNRAMGSYSGIDTVDLISDLHYGEQERSHLSFLRDMIAMNQRSDYRLFISRLPEKDRQITREYAQALLEESNALCDDEAMVFNQHKSGATYIPLEDAFDLQMQMKTEGSRSIVH
jgi:hypothetical protein